MKTEFNRSEMRNLERCLCAVRHLEPSVISEADIKIMLHKIHKMTAEMTVQRGQPEKMYQTSAILPPFFVQ